MTRHILAVTCALGLAVSASAQRPAPNYPAPVEADFTLTNFHFNSGETMDVRMHYRTVGTLAKNAQGQATNAVLVMHGTGGTGATFVGASFAGELFGPGQPLDGTKFFIIMPDDVGHGGSSKPSNGLHARFPAYRYDDMVVAEYRLLTEGLGVNHARLVMGTSMGAMHTWIWGEKYPSFMDALMPLASVPGPMSGRNRAWRRVIIDAIRNDPEWKNGEYTTQPPSLRTAAEMLYLVSSNNTLRQKESPTTAKADANLDAYVANYMRTGDANDTLHWFEASADYDPSPSLEKITAPLYAVNTADDIINPPELGILEAGITRVPHGKAVVIPQSDKTAGHGTHTLAAVWKQYLIELLATSERK